MSAPIIRALVAVDATIDSRTVELVVDDPHIQVVGVIDQDSEPADPTAADVLLVACGAPPRRRSSSSRPRGARRVSRRRRLRRQPQRVRGDVLSSGADDIVLARGQPDARPGDVLRHAEGHGPARALLGADRPTAGSSASWARKAGSARR